MATYEGGSGLGAKIQTLLDESVQPPPSFAPYGGGQKQSRYSNPLSRILSSISRFHSDSGYWGLSSLVSFILTENHCLVEVVARELQVGFERNYGIYGWTRVCF